MTPQEQADAVRRYLESLGITNKSSNDERPSLGIPRLQIDQDFMSDAPQDMGEEEAVIQERSGLGDVSSDLTPEAVLSPQRSMRHLQVSVRPQSMEPRRALRHIGASNAGHALERPSSEWVERAYQSAEETRLPPSRRSPLEFDYDRRLNLSQSPPRQVSRGPSLFTEEQPLPRYANDLGARLGETPEDLAFRAQEIADPRMIRAIRGTQMSPRPQSLDEPRAVPHLQQNAGDALEHPSSEWVERAYQSQDAIHSPKHPEEYRRREKRGGASIDSGQASVDTLNSSKNRAHEEQVLAQVGQGAGQAVGQTAADFTQRAEDMRRPWQLGPIEFDFGRRPATPTHEQQTLASVAQGAGDAVGQTTADLARRIQNRPWELGEIEFDFSGRQAPSPPTYEQQALAQMASGTGNAIGQTTGDLARRLQLRPPMQLSTHEQQVLGQVARGAGDAVGQTVGDFTRRSEDAARPPMLELAQVDVPLGPRGQRMKNSLHRPDATPSMVDMYESRMQGSAPLSLASSTDSTEEPVPFFQLPEVDATWTGGVPSNSGKERVPFFKLPEVDATWTPPAEGEEPVVADQSTAAPQSAQAEEPVVAPEASEDPSLAAARRRDRRANIIRGVLGGVGGIIGLVGAARDNPAMAGIGLGLGRGSLVGINPRRNENEYLQDRAIQRQDDELAYQRSTDEQNRALAAADREIASEDRAINNNYRQAQIDNLNANAEYRRALADRDGPNSVANNPDSPAAKARRDTIRRLIVSSPDAIRAAYRGVDLDGLTSSELRDVASDILRRTQSLPVGQRHVKTRRIERLIAEMEAADLAEMAGNGATPPASAVPSSSAAPAPAPSGGGGRQRPRRNDYAQSMGPDFQGPVPPTEQGQQPVPSAGQPQSSATVRPQERRNRTLAEIVSDKNRQLRGQPLLSGLTRYDDYTPEEDRIVSAATSSRSSGVRNDGLYLQDRGSTSQQFDVARTNLGIYTDRDFQRAAPLITGITQVRNRAGNLLNLTRNMTQAQFTAAVSGNSAAARLLGVEDIASRIRALTGQMLHDISGAAVTASELQRFQDQTSTNRLNSPQAFRAALRMILQASDTDLENSGYNADFMRQWNARRRGIAAGAGR